MNEHLDTSKGEGVSGHVLLFSGDKADYAFHTDKEKNPWAKVDLGAVKMVNAVVVENRPNEQRADGLILSISEDGQKWEEVWRAKTWETTWVVAVTHFDAGINAPGTPGEVHPGGNEKRSPQGTAAPQFSG